MRLTKETGADSNILNERISSKHLVNILNYVNFKGDSVVVNLRRIQDGSMLSLKATP